jgi:hypothetical protein
VVISGAGQALQVAHDAIITGNLTVVGNTLFSGYEIDLNDITSNTVHANTGTFGTIVVTGDESVTGNVTVGGNLTVNGDFSGTGTANLSTNILATSLAFSIALG